MLAFYTVTVAENTAFALYYFFLSDHQQVLRLAALGLVFGGMALGECLCGIALASLRLSFASFVLKYGDLTLFMYFFFFFILLYDWKFFIVCCFSVCIEM